jgi:uncharacterized membrane protein YedE/YeeE
VKYLVTFGAGILFAVGLVISGMTQPSKVVGFLDFFGRWDPSLAFVMGGAVIINAILYRFIIKRSRPFYDPEFHLPTRKDLDWRLIVGGGMFGVGWGLAGYCPGPGITSVVSLQTPVVVFVAAMAVGMLIFSLFDKVTTDDA